jgi:hypothetical protein
MRYELDDEYSLSIFFDTNDLPAGHITWHKTDNKCYLVGRDDEGKGYIELRCLGDCFSREDLEKIYALKSFY